MDASYFLELLNCNLRFRVVDHTLIDFKDNVKCVKIFF